MMMKARLLTLYFCFSFCATALAQLSPPGLGETNTASWSALGVKQKFSEKNTSTTYVGLGRISGPEAENPFSNPSILVFNEEVSHKINKSWQYSYAVSYRRQHDYDEGFKVPEAAGIKQEFRLYGRLKYTVDLGGPKWTTTLRQEARKFYTDNFEQVSDGFQLRTRVKTQLSVPLDSDSENNILGSAEALFSIADDRNEGWEKPAYKESRFCLYYSYAPNSLPVTFDIGYMNDLIGYGRHTTDANYLAMDIIIENPF
jgi:hypothetical protein